LLQSIIALKTGKGIQGDEQQKGREKEIERERTVGVNQNRVIPLKGFFHTPAN